MTAIDGPLLLVVLDGVGEEANTVGNAVHLAHTPFWDELRKRHRFTTLCAHGRAVGLPSDGDMGNSEVGHNALGAGQVYDQGAKLVADAITSGNIFAGDTWKQALDQVKNRGTTLHFMGLLSDGNVHSHIEHLITMIHRAGEEGLARVRVHVLLDGRDVGGTTAQLYIEQLEKNLSVWVNKGRDYRIASGGGRMKVTMDRYEADWEMVKTGWQLHVRGQGRGFPDAMTALEVLRSETPGIIDQNLGGFVITDEHGPVGPIGDGDSVLFFNFRGDRALEITRAFEEGASFSGFDRGDRPDVFYAGMMQYDGDLMLPSRYLVGPPHIANTLTELLVNNGVPQYAISETQKYGHVTYFWNGNRSGKLDEQSESFVEIPSDNVSFDQRPWMKAAEITDALLATLETGKQRFLRCNYANGDMVGHTGNLDAAMTAMSCLDLQLQRLMAGVRRAGGVALITADHGNCDQMFECDKQGNPILSSSGVPKAKTSHSLARVPFVLFDPLAKVPGSLAISEQLGLANVAATVAHLLGIKPHGDWHGSLI